MSKKPVFLTVHKNTKDRRDRRDVANRMRRAVQDINSDKQVRGFAIVAWTDEFDARVEWHFDKVESSRSTPERVKQSLISALDQFSETE